MTSVAGTAVRSATATEGAAVEPRLARDLLVLVAAFLPALGAAVLKVFVHPRPFWVYFYDPETFYFHDGLRLLSGHAPLDFTNPGTPLQIVSAVIAASTGTSPDDFDRFRVTAYCVAWAMQLVAGWGLLRTVLAKLPAPLSIAALATYFVCPQTLEYQTVWSPEVWFLPAGALAIVAIWRALNRSFDGRSAFAAGAAVGLACALKLVFLPWVPALALTAWLRSRRPGRLRAAGLCMAGLAVAFLVFTLPAAANYPQMTSWIGRMATRSGAYGETQRLVPDAAALMSTAYSLLTAAKGWYGCVLLAAIGAVVAIRHARGTSQGRQLSGLGLFAATAFVGQQLMVLRTPSLRYVIPAGLCGVLLAAIAARVPAVQHHQSAQWVALLVVGLLAGKHFAGDLATHQRRIREASATRTELLTAVRAATPEAHPVVVFGHRAPIPSLALRYFSTDPVFLGKVESRYPGEGHLGPGDRLFLPSDARHWDVLVLTPGNLHQWAGAPRAQAVAHVGGFDVLVPGDGS